jgi:TetR/AcrR family transcriptional regulator
MEPIREEDAAVSGAGEAAATRGGRAPRMKPGERREHILQTLAAMLEAPKGEKITTAALAARLGVSEAALYRQFASKAQMYEALIAFIETTVFGLINQITAKEPDGVLQARAIGLMLLTFAARNRGMTRVLTGEALVGEHERLAERVARLIERVEASLRQCLRLALTRGDAGGSAGAGPTPPIAPLPADYDPAVRANLMISYIQGRWHRYAASGFARTPAEHADAQLRLILQ